MAFVVEDSNNVQSDTNWNAVNQFLEALVNRLNVNTDNRLQENPLTRIAEVKLYFVACPSAQTNDPDNPLAHKVGYSSTRNYFFKVLDAYYV